MAEAGVGLAEMGPIGLGIAGVGLAGYGIYRGVKALRNRRAAQAAARQQALDQRRQTPAGPQQPVDDHDQPPAKRPKPDTHPADHPLPSTDAHDGEGPAVQTFYGAHNLAHSQNGRSTSCACCSTRVSSSVLRGTALSRASTLLLRHARRRCHRAAHTRLRAAPMRAKKGRTGTKRRSAGMQKHAAPVSVGTSMSHGTRGPAGVGYRMTQVSDTCTRIVGRAYVGEVTTTGKVATGGTGSGLGLMFDINPALLNDRVAIIASTFEKYVYHSFKLTYVPQCSTATGGSVALAFDRDPLMYTANTQGTQFLSEVMSYEHAVLTPTYVQASTSYARDPKELKTWFLGGTDATLTTRETSQGNAVVYLSNVPPNTGLGFIVMDYVLDLVAPNLLPAKQGVTNIYSGPSQWRDASGSRIGNGARANTTFPANGNVTVPVGNGITGLCLFDPPTNWQTYINAGQPGGVLRPGVVGEIQFGGCVGDDTSLAVATFITADNQSVTIKAGQKLYFTQRVVNTAGTGTDVPAVSFHLTLGSARAASTDNVPRTAAATGSTFGDYLFWAGVNPDISGWLRLITDGAGVANTA